APTRLTVDWAGTGEVEATEYEMMSLSVDNQLVGSAHAPGGGRGCEPMEPVVSDPPPPQQVLLTPGLHTLFIDASTRDSFFHFEAWYQFTLAFDPAP
ncbi:MAG: hypothetical protein NNA30_12160, partial [Nitrospira sp.]|nr:hypothetical protein [Nitrospira sp.]